MPDPQELNPEVLDRLRDVRDLHGAKEGFSVEDTVRGIGYGAINAAGAVWDLADTLSGDYLPDFKPLETETKFGGFVSGLTQFTVGWLSTGAALGKVAQGSGKLAQAAGFLNKGGVLSSAGKGALTDFSFFSGHTGRLSDWATEAYPDSPLDNPITQWLASDPDDTEFEGRLKNVVEGAGMGILWDGVIRVAGRAIKSARAKIEVGDVAGAKADIAQAEETVSSNMEALKEEHISTGKSTPDPVMDSKEAESILEAKGVVKDVAPEEVDETIPGAIEIPQVDPTPLPRHATNSVEDFKSVQDSRSEILNQIDEGEVNFRSNPRDLARAERNRLKIHFKDFNLLRSQSPDEAIATSRAIERFAADNGAYTDRKTVLQSIEDGKAALQEMFGWSKHETESHYQRMTRGMGDTLEDLQKINGRIIGFKMQTEMATAELNAVFSKVDIDEVTDPEEMYSYLSMFTQVGDMFGGLKGLIGEQSAGLRSHRGLTPGAVATGDLGGFTAGSNFAGPSAPSTKKTPSKPKKNYKKGKNTDDIFIDGEPGPRDLFIDLEDAVVVRELENAKAAELSKSDVFSFDDQGDVFFDGEKVTKDIFFNMADDSANRLRLLEAQDQDLIARMKALKKEADKAREDVHLDFDDKPDSGADSFVDVESLGIREQARSGPKMPPTAAELAKEHAERLQNATGTKNIGKAMAKARTTFKFIKATMEANGEAGLMQATRGMQSGSVLAMTVELWTAGILSGVKSLQTALVGNTTQLFMRMAETGAGNALMKFRYGADVKGLDSGVHQWQEVVSTFMDLVRFKGGPTWDSFKTAFKNDGTGVIRDRPVNRFNSGADPAVTKEKIQSSWIGHSLRAFGAAGGVADEVVSTAGDAYGKGIRKLSFGLLGAADEAAFEVNFRVKAKGIFRTKGIERGLSGDALDEFVVEQYNRAYVNGQATTLDRLRKQAQDEAKQEFIDGGFDAASSDPLALSKLADRKLNAIFDGELDDVVNESIEFAREGVFQESNEEIGGLFGTVGSGIGRMTNAYPPLKFIAPFVTIPTNVLYQAHRRTSEPIAAGVRWTLGSIGKKVGMELPEAAESANRTLRDIAAGGRKQRDAYGRISTGAATLATAGMFASNAWDDDAKVGIIGKGPRDPKEAAAWREAGMQEYSIFFGKAGERSYVSFKRNDPIAMILGIAADITQYTYYTDEADQDWLDKSIASVWQATIFNLANKSYLVGIQNMFDAIGKGDAKGANRVITGFGRSVVPNVAGQFTAETDNTMREARTFTDAMLSRVPFYSGDLEPKRNLLGEERKRAPTWEESPAAAAMSRWTIFPVTSEEQADPISIALAETGHGWSRPQARDRKSGLDLRNLKNETGQSAYDRLQELTGTMKLFGQTLRENMTEVIQSEDYKSYVRPDNLVSTSDDLRVKLLGGSLSMFRAAAKEQVIQEYPELNEAQENRLEGLR